jgi:DNA-binding Xre family transcriptional regulator
MRREVGMWNRYYRLYSTWKNMRSRCNSPNNKDYKRYGGRGIKVCKEWEDFKVFSGDMYPSFIEGLSLDRRDNDKGYSKSNCRWVDQKTQCNNKKGIVRLEYRGTTVTQTQLSKILGISSSTLHRRRGEGLKGDELGVSRKLGKLHRILGVEYNQRELSEILNISSQNLNLRIKREGAKGVIDEVRRIQETKC